VCENCAADRAAVTDVLRGARRIVLTTHERPDGDGLGSMLALYLAATAAGKQCTMTALDEIPRRYAFLFRGRRLAPPEDFAALADAADAIVVIDTCAFEQLCRIEAALKARRSKVVVIDHHATAQDVAEAIWRDESAAGAGVMVAELLEELGWPAAGDVAEALLTAIVADTGWFRYANTDARALRWAASLVEAGVGVRELYERLYESDRPERLRLLAAALGSLRLHADDRLAVMTLTRADFSRARAAEDETEEIVNEGLRIAGVEIAALIIERPDGTARASLRSRRVVDVAQIAKRFGGGGHARASGFRSEKGVLAVRDELIAACEKALKAADATE